MKTLGKVLALLVIIIIGAVLLLPLFISTDDVFARISDEVKSTTGRELTIHGEKSFSLFPSLALQLNDVRFANMKGGTGADMMRMAKLDVFIPWSALLSGKLVVERFVINEPIILLETNPQGKPNWQFVGQSTSVQPTTTTPDIDVVDPFEVELPDSFDIRLDKIQINGGKLTYKDGLTKQTKVVEQLSLAINLPSIRQPLTIDGSVGYMAQTFKLSAKVDTPIKFLEQKPVGLDLKLASALLNLTYQGKVSDQGKNIIGNMSVDGDSVKDIFNWQKQPLTAKASAFNQFSLSAQIGFDQKTLTLSKFTAKLDELNITGESKVTLSTPPKIDLDIDLGVLNLNPYLPEPSADSTPEPAAKPGQPIVWDNTPIDLSALGQVNVDIKIQSTQLIINEIKLGKNKFSLTLNNSRAHLKLIEFDAYKGKGVGDVQVNAASKPYQIKTEFDFSGIDAGPLLTDAIGFDKVLGKGQLNWQLTTSGVSQRDFVSHLNGKLRFKFLDGAVKGVNLAALARSAGNLMTGNFKAMSLDKDFSDAEKTDFASLQASFGFKNGVGTNTDLALVNPFISLTGQGTADLPATNLDFKTKTTVSLQIEADSAGQSSSAVVIPIKIKGPFHQLNVRPDLSSSAKDKAKDKLKEKLKEKLKGLFN